MKFDGFMRLAVASAMAFPCLIGLGAQAAPKTSIGANAYDGVYSVEIITDEGSCDKAYRWSVAIVDGRVSSTGDVVAEASGQIDGRGELSLAFRRNDQVAHAAGRVSGTWGQGTWNSASLKCGGHWRAERRNAA